jgi:hypothetical protein
LRGAADARSLLDAHPTLSNSTSQRGPTEDLGACLVGQRRASTHRTQSKKTLIVREWQRWLRAHSIDHRAATPRDTLNFFYELQDKRSSLLKFHPRGRDKWKIINGWLLGEPGAQQARSFVRCSLPRETSRRAVTSAK